MNNLDVNGNWIEAAGNLKNKFSNRSLDPSIFRVRKEEEILGRLQKRLGKTREEIKSMFWKP